MNKWIDIIGYEGQYKINKEGQIFSLKSNKIMKNVICKSGYHVITLSKGTRKSKKQFKVHRLLMQHFRPINNDQNYVVNHIDGNKLNNNISNLEWCTVEENNQHALDNKLNVGNPKIDEHEAFEIKIKMVEFMSNKVRNMTQIEYSRLLANEYNLSHRTVLDIYFGYRRKNIKLDGNLSQE